MADLENQRMKTNISNNTVKEINNANDMDGKCCRTNNYIKNDSNSKKYILNNLHSEEIINIGDKINVKKIETIKELENISVNTSIVNTSTVNTSTANTSTVNTSTVNTSTSTVNDGTVRKGRFVVEKAKMTSIESSSTVQFRRGRFYITQTIDDDEKTKKEVKQMINIINLQNKQIDLLFDMVKNISGEDKLFQKEFLFIANEVYENIEMLKRGKGE